MTKKNIKLINGKGASSSVIRYVNLAIAPAPNYHYTNLELIDLFNTCNEIKRDLEIVESKLIRRELRLRHVEDLAERNILNIEIEELTGLRLHYETEIANFSYTLENQTIDGSEEEEEEEKVEEEEIRNADSTNFSNGRGLKSKTSKWIDHVKTHSKEHNISY